MKRLLMLAAVLILIPSLTAQSQLRYSTGAVRDYIPNGCGGPDLPGTVPEADNFRAWYSLGGFSLVTQWTNTNVWGADFRDGTDTDPSGGSDIVDVYFYTGHGICQNPPAAGSGDFITVCSPNGTPNTTTIGTSSRWGNGSGRLKFAFIDASCPMDLVSLSNQWFPVFRNLHMGVGHSGTTTSDTLDSVTRGSQFAANTAGLPPPLGWIIPEMSVGDAWMADGIIDIQSGGCCAVAIAAGNDRNDAINRRENERVKSGWGNPTPNWFAWKWMCR